MTSLVDAESVLAIDIGSLNTRVLLFDVVDGQYHFIASASASTTAGAPFHDISEGVHIALTRLQEITGRIFSDDESRLIVPSQADGSGVDRLALTFSCGRVLNLMAMGLLADVSLQSAQRLAGTTYARLVDSIGLNDRRRFETQLGAILQARPDIIVLAGGTEKGSSRSVGRFVDLITMACRVLPRENRPKVLYCGNGTLSKRVAEVLARETEVIVAPNIRPTIDHEDLSPAETRLAKMVAEIRTLQVGGLNDLASLSSSNVLPSAYALGRMMRFSSELSGLAKPTLGIDLGAGATTMALAQAGNLQLSVFRNLGMGGALFKSLQQIRVEDVSRWMPYDLPQSEIQDYLYQRSMFPASLPLTPETLAIEQGMARQILRQAMLQMFNRWPGSEVSFERVFLSGATLTQAATPAQSLLIVLDGIQPVGINVFMLDPYGLSQALGAIAGSNTLLPAQIIDSGAYDNLGTVICPVSNARPGTVILRIRMAYEDGTDARLEVKQGELVPLPVRNGQVVNIEIDPQHGTILDPFLPRLRRFKITGGLCGALVDARGRPLGLPADAARRSEVLRGWARIMEERRLV